MSDKPVDIQAKAALVWSKMGFVNDRLDQRKFIAEAIQEERERCARIVEVYCDHPNELIAFIGREITESVRR